MISHKDKGINSILYNYLNLPSAVISEVAEEQVPLHIFTEQMVLNLK